MLTEQERRQSKTAQILALLKREGTVYNTQLTTVCLRYSARILELRREGHLIATNDLGYGLFSFTYNGHRDEEDVEKVFDEVQ